MKINITLTSLGCPKNLIDSEKLLGALPIDKYNISNDLSQADIVIINTCSFIDSAKEESINTILQIADFKDMYNLHFKIMVTGCIVKQYKKELEKEIPEIDAFLTFDQYPLLEKYITALLKNTKVPKPTKNITKYFDMPKRYLLTPTHYSFLKIAEGCSNCCSYCSIPKIRGPYKSRSEKDIIAEANKLADKGVKEIIITAQDITFYGKDKNGVSALPTLLTKLCKVKKIKWIRLMYLHPAHITDDLIQTIKKEKKICRYLDIPLQHINDRILKDMNRKITKQAIVDVLNKIRKEIPGIYLRTTFITGYPGETPKEFNELFEFVKEMRFERLGCFTYSPQEGTKAEKKEKQVSEKTKQKRLDKIMMLQHDISAEKNKALRGKKMKVLLDKKHEKKENTFFARTFGDAPDIDLYIKVSGDKLKEGQFKDVIVTKTDAYNITGKLA